MSGCGHFTFAADDPACAELGMGAAALRYAGLGYAVLPLDRGGKRPHRMLGDRGGVHWATRDPAAIRWCWTQDRAANVGVATGQTSGLVVIDLDIKGATSGIATFADFLTYSYLQPGDFGLPWPDDVPYVVTPSGGMHLWLRAGQPVPNRVGILPGVDVRGDGGLVAAPPSLRLKAPAARPGERGAAAVPLPYLWTGCPCVTPAAPAWLGGWLASAPAAAGGAGSGEPVPDLGELSATGIPEGQRNVTMYRLACSLHRQRPGDPGWVTDRLREVWERTSHADFGWPEVLGISDSARRFIEADRQRERGPVDAFMRWVDASG